MYPIKTIENENAIVKICTEDIHKITDFIGNMADDVADEINNMLVEQYPDNTMTNVGVAKCTTDDAFNVEIGREIAFRKVKLYANLKKKRLLERSISMLEKVIKSYQNKMTKLNKYIDKDIEALRTFNPKYNINQ